MRGTGGAWPCMALAAMLMLAGACGPAGQDDAAAGELGAAPGVDIETRLSRYTEVELTTEAELDATQRRVLTLLVEAADLMNPLFWDQVYGDRDALLSRLASPELRRFAEINYGPWDRLAEDEPFVEGVDAKPPGANLYPADVTVDELEAAAAMADDGGAALRSLYTLVRRDGAGGLVAVPYHEEYADTLSRAAGKLREAAGLTGEPGLQRYLELRAEALETDEFQASDMAWMEMKDNSIDIIIGPIETYEDQLFGYKAAYEGIVLVKDREWSERLARYTALLPERQRGLPVEGEYRREQPGTDSDLNAYDVVYYAGDANAGPKSIAINLPNDEEVQLQKGTRRLQLKNSMRAKFDEILVPISDLLIDPGQRQHITFDAFFANTMFHEVAHGLGIKHTVDGERTVREALREQASWLEEGKADVLGLYMVTRLHETGGLDGGSLEDYYVTFLASVFRSIRFGATSAHGRANLVRFNFFAERGAFARDAERGTYRVDMAAMRDAVDALSRRILHLQGDGDHPGAVAFWEETGAVGPQLEADLERVAGAGIPVDIVFSQGPERLRPRQPAAKP